MSPLDPVDREAIRRHMFASYTGMRVGIALVAIAFPLILFIAGKLNAVGLQGSMSAYYWAAGANDAPSRIWFIGGLFAIGAVIYLYKGFTIGENLALNLAGLFALGVAYFPMEWNCDKAMPPLNPTAIEYCWKGDWFPWNPHGICAMALFVCLAYVTSLRSLDTLPALANENLRKRYRIAYRLTSLFMLGAPIAALVMHAVFKKQDAYTYFAELFGIVAFAIYWLIKSLEMRQSQFEKRLLSSTPT